MGDSEFVEVVDMCEAEYDGCEEDGGFIRGLGEEKERYRCRSEEYFFCDRALVAC